MLQKHTDGPEYLILAIERGTALNPRKTRQAPIQSKDESIQNFSGFD